MKLWLQIHAVATWFVLTKAGWPGVTNTWLNINIPHSLSKPGDGYYHRQALFGFPSHGGSIAEKVYYADSDLCDPNVDTHKGYPERKPGTDGKMKPWQAPYILLVDRGNVDRANNDDGFNCSFVQQVRNGQRAGAAAVVIADTICFCFDVSCTAQTQGACQVDSPVVADDGSGGDISIPSFLMSKRDADMLKQELMADRQVQMELSWSLPSTIPDDRVEYDIWVSPVDSFSRDFFKSFKPIANALGSHARFTPYMHIFDGVHYNCQLKDGENFCFQLCTNNGRYCAVPGKGLDNGISGVDIVKESLRRLCIWWQYGLDSGIGLQWWEYVAYFNDHYLSFAYFANDDAVKDSYKHAMIDGLLIERCMRDSGGLEKDRSNFILDLQLASQRERGVFTVPTASVNQTVIDGALTVRNVFSAICSKYTLGAAPSVCTQCLESPDIGSCISSGGNNHPSSNRNRSFMSGPVVSFFGLLFVLVYSVEKIYQYYNWHAGKEL